MRISRVIHEDFSNYKKPSMFIGTPFCDGKCWREAGLPSSTCQNYELMGSKTMDVDTEFLCEQYVNNPITKAVVFGGLEPFDSFGVMYGFICTLRKKFKCDDDVVIYTGYTKYEVSRNLQDLKQFRNIIVKFGRYIPNDTPVDDSVLGVTLASSNQYAVKIS